MFIDFFHWCIHSLLCSWTWNSSDWNKSYELLCKVRLSSLHPHGLIDLTLNKEHADKSRQRWQTIALCVIWAVLNITRGINIISHGHFDVSSHCNSWTKEAELFILTLKSTGCFGDKKYLFHNKPKGLKWEVEIWDIIMSMKQMEIPSGDLEQEMRGIKSTPISHSTVKSEKWESDANKRKKWRGIQPTRGQKQDRRTVKDYIAQGQPNRTEFM